jgi:isoquinoline 1-oxidoreductase beta subunit
MGQGIHTALAQIAAEELEVAWEQLEVHHADTGRAIDGGITSGSNSVSSMFTPLREAAATVREMLRGEAALALGVSPGELTAQDGHFLVNNDPEQSISYGEVVQRVAVWEIPETPPTLKAVNEYHTIGQSQPRVDLRAKVLGEAVYGYDARLPNMLYAAIARPDVLNSKIRRAAPGDAPQQSGVVSVVANEAFAGVAAESRAQAQAALTSLEIEWDEGELFQQADIEALTTVGEGNGVVIQKEGDAAGELRDDAGVVIGEYRTPVAAHAHLEPQSVLVDVQPDVVSVYVSTQAPYMVRSSVAEALGRDEEEINVIPVYLGGGLGSKVGTESAAQAALLSQEAGRPVHLGWTRNEDLRYGYFRPPTHHVLRAKVDESGRMRVMDHQQASGDVAFPFLPPFLPAVMGADFGAWRGATIPYDIPHRQTVAWRIKLPFPTGWWRGLGLLANVYALESFVDEVAQATGTDPLEFRLQQLPPGELGARMRVVLERVAEAANWGGSLPAGHAQGLAVCVDVNTVVAQIAEVSVENNQPRVHRVDAVIDPGLVINPDGVKAQTQGAIIMGLSSTLREEITFKDGMVEASNFDRYPLLTNAEAPHIEVTTISSGDSPYGVGEPPIGPIAAATGNALFALTGRRLRRLPFTLSI